MTKYLQQLAEKTTRLSALLAPFQAPELDVFTSSETHYRMRAEFRIWRDTDMHYAMGTPGQAINSKSVIFLDDFPPACAAINALMPKLLAALRENSTLSARLYQVEFLATLAGDMLVTLIYHRKLDEAWEKSARALEAALNIAIIGRSRGQKLTLSRDYVKETLHVDGKAFHYHQYEQSFSQPNAEVCEKMLTWACAQVREDARDLLELYCGNGNFTLPLAAHFRNVLATEMSKSGIKALRENKALNHVDNVAVARLSAEEFTDAFNGVREFTRLQLEAIDLKAYQFDYVFVDPPRAGIDVATLALLQRFPRIIYISCNPETLAENLRILNTTHQIKACALFDQFPFTPHIEAGVFLEKR